MSDTTYGYSFFAGYPVLAADCGYEPGVRKLGSIPTPLDVYNYALLGIPKVMPLTGEVIPLDFAEDALQSAIAEIEMSTGMNISEVVHHFPEDFIVGKFGLNCTGTQLPKWPASEIVKVSLKFPNANTNSVYQEVVIPPTWIFLSKNKMNITPSSGSASGSTSSGVATPQYGVYAYFMGIQQSYSPGILEIVYKAGFKQDQLPANLVDLIKTWASFRLITDLLPILFPHSGVSVSIDGVNQSVQFNIQSMLTNRLEGLDKKRQDLIKSLKSQYKSVISTTFVGV